MSLQDRRSPRIQVSIRARASPLPAVARDIATKFTILEIPRRKIGSPEASDERRQVVGSGTFPG